MTENLYTPNCIRTHTGKYVNVFETTPEMIDIVDIAHALAMNSRFGGHLPQHYSIAQHSYACSLIVPAKDRLAALMHDASEAYLLDMPKPIKNRMPEYCGIEDKLMSVIAIKFGFEYPKPLSVERADVVRLEMEWDGMMLGLGDQIDCWSQMKAKDLFLKRFLELTNPK